MALSSKFEEGGCDELEKICSSDETKGEIRLAALQTRAVLWLQRSNWAKAKEDFEQILSNFPHAIDEQMVKHGLAIVTHRSMGNKSDIKQAIMLFDELEERDSLEGCNEVTISSS